MLKESYDQCVRDVVPTLATWRKRDIVGQVQYGRGGLGLGSTTPTWWKVTPKEQRHLVVEEVQLQEEASRCACQSSLSSPTRLLDEVGRHWTDHWTDQNHLEWAVGYGNKQFYSLSHNVLPSSTNLHKWCRQDPARHLCATSANFSTFLS